MGNTREERSAQFATDAITDIRKLFLSIGDRVVNDEILPNAYKHVGIFGAAAILKVVAQIEQDVQQVDFQKAKEIILFNVSSAIDMLMKIKNNNEGQQQ